MARQRDYAAEYARRNARALESGYTSYSQLRRNMPKYGPVGQSTPGARPRARPRIHDAVGVGEDVYEDWQENAFGSTRVARARYSRSRRELQVAWANGRTPYIYDGVDPTVWENFVSAGSAGQFVNHTLNSYPYRPAAEISGEF